MIECANCGKQFNMGEDEKFGEAANRHGLITVNGPRADGGRRWATFCNYTCAAQRIGMIAMRREGWSGRVKLPAGSFSEEGANPGAGS